MVVSGRRDEVEGSARSSLGELRGGWWSGSLPGRRGLQREGAMKGHKAWGAVAGLSSGGSKLRGLGTNTSSTHGSELSTDGFKEAGLEVQQTTHAVLPAPLTVAPE